MPPAPILHHWYVIEGRTLEQIAGSSTLPALSVDSGWVFHVSGAEIANTLQRAGAQVVNADPLDYAFISFA